MTEDDPTGHSSAAAADRMAAVLAPPQRRRHRRRWLFRREKRYNRRIRWLRLLALLAPLCFLALISMAFGAVLAVEPQIAPLVKSLKAHYTEGANSVLYSAPPGVQQIAVLTNHNQFFLAPNDIPLDSLIAHAVIAIEDKRFLSEPAIDYRSVARALVSDIFGGGGTQGASTITEQFVKTALDQGQPSQRTIVEKIREAFTAFQLTHLWHKQKILTEYLNTTNFGVATGVEAAAQAWFGNDPNSNLFGCGQRANVNNLESLCVTNLTADEAALLAGIINSPNTYVDQLTTDPQLVLDRRNEVLQAMLQQNYLTQGEYDADIQVTLPSPQYVESPSEENTNPITGYFASWVANQLASNATFGKLVYGGGLRVYTTLDLKLEDAARRAVEHYLPQYSGPSAALVAIDNATGDVKAMFGGYNYTTHAFNLATQAERQPGSAWKVFDLAVALEAGYKPSYRVLSKPFPFPAEPPFYPPFTFHDDEGGYAYTKIPLSQALAVSDNTVFARLSLDTPGTGVTRIATLAKDWGISTGISLNPSMVIGGLTEGVTPLDMAHAYETLAQDGLVTGTLASQACAGGPKGFTQENAPTPGQLGCPGPVGIRFVAQGSGKTARSPSAWHNHSYIFSPAFPSAKDDQTEIAMMHGPLSSIGTAADAYIPGVGAWGKTGTTSNYTDAWFCGSTPNLNTADGKVPSMTACVWVGYPNSARSMAKNFGGKPVYGGTYPALIWRDYVVNAIQTIEQENVAVHQHAIARAQARHSTGAGSTGASGATSTSATQTASSTTTTPTGTTQNGGTAANPGSQTGTTSPGTTPPATNTNTGTGTTNAGGTTPATNPPQTGTPTPPPATTTPTTPPPATSQGGGVTAPGGGAIGPTG
ncbi:MAG TPA: transglycosylase domain-containing protein [Solirubrobacteraceae bacterium]|nr:transglycosylase domain-containing protein [Solirubrobacteraceae bacterium]